MGKISTDKEIFNWLELEEEEENEDPLLGLPFVVEQRPQLGIGTAFSHQTNAFIADLGSEEEPPFAEDNCFLGWLSTFLHHVRAQQEPPVDNANIVVPSPLNKNAETITVVSKAPEADSLSCAATSVNSSVDGDTDSRKERKRCMLRHGSIHIERLDAAAVEDNPRAPSLRHHGYQSDFQYQEYLSSQRLRR